MVQNSTKFNGLSHKCTESIYLIPNFDIVFWHRVRDPKKMTEEIEGSFSVRPQKG